MSAMESIREAARGHWPAILPGFGIGSQYLSNRHGPCPGCGGRDRFRFDDREGRGTFFCGGGGQPLAGDGFDLIGHVTGLSAREVAQAVASHLHIEIGRHIDEPPLRPVARPEPASATGRYAAELWSRANREDAVVAGHAYAKAKRIGWAAGAGRVRASGRLIGQDADCIIVPIRTPAGELVAVEVLSASRDPAGKFLRQSFGPKRDGFLVLGNDLDPRLPRYVVEGWATGAKLLEYMGGNCAVYVAFGAGRLRPVAEAVERHWPGSEVIICTEAPHHG